ncbi:MAG: hypothetical protein ACOCT0_06120 [Halobacteriota archaeon]
MRTRLVVVALLAVAVGVSVNLYPSVEDLPYHAGVVVSTSTGAAIFFLLLWVVHEAGYLD